MAQPKTFKGKIRASLIGMAYPIGRAVSWIYSFKISALKLEWMDAFYSGWLSRSFKSCGINNQIAYPIYCVGANYITIGTNFISGPRLRIEAHDRFMDTLYTPKITIGDFVNLNFDCHIGCVDEIFIGNNVLVASKVLIIDHFHGETTKESMILPPVQRNLVTKGPIKIGNNVWIGESAVIMPGVNLGDNCIVGANSVVTKSFENNVVIGGNPAKIIRYIT